MKKPKKTEWDIGYDAGYLDAKADILTIIEDEYDFNEKRIVGRIKKEIK